MLSQETATREGTGNIAVGKEKTGVLGWEYSREQGEDQSHSARVQPWAMEETKAPRMELRTPSARQAEGGKISRVTWSRALHGEVGCGGGVARGKHLLNPPEVAWASPGHVLP